ncbi:MAG: 30S ribosomal protein S27e [Candidatus Micrarchaeota archaeon]
MSKFLSVQCKCGKKTVVFGNSSEAVECQCGAVVTKPTGGRTVVNGKVLEVLS